MRTKQAQEKSVGRLKVGFCQQVLAATNHRQWIMWQQRLEAALKDRHTAALQPLLEGPLPAEWQQLIQSNALVVTNLVHNILGVPSEMRTVPHRDIYERKLAQLRGWIEYALTQPVEKIFRWRRLCNTPFIELSPKEQESDFVEAERDLRAVFEAYGMSLPDWFRAAAPQTGFTVPLQRFLHARGRHGSFLVSEEPWSLTCQTCHATRRYSP